MFYIINGENAAYFNRLLLYGRCLMQTKYLLEKKRKIRNKSPKSSVVAHQPLSELMPSPSSSSGSNFRLILGKLFFNEFHLGKQHVYPKQQQKVTFAFLRRAYRMAARGRCRAAETPPVSSRFVFCTTLFLFVNVSTTHN